LIFDFYAKKASRKACAAIIFCLSKSCKDKGHKKQGFARSMRSLASHRILNPRMFVQRRDTKIVSFYPFEKITLCLYEATGERNHGFPKGNNQALCLNFYYVKPKLCFAQPCMGKSPKETKSFMTNFLLVGVNCFARDKVKKLWCPFFISYPLFVRVLLQICHIIVFLFLQLVNKSKDI